MCAVVTRLQLSAVGRRRNVLSPCAHTRDKRQSDETPKFYICVCVYGLTNDDGGGGGVLTDWRYRKRVYDIEPSAADEQKKKTIFKYTYRRARACVYVRVRVCARVRCRAREPRRCCSRIGCVCFTAGPEDNPVSPGARLRRPPPPSTPLPRDGRPFPSTRRAPSDRAKIR